ncbi:hydrogenase maturation protease [Thermacetogenium phaeum DSM 12270]|uniref:Hydrogenase maturation protease n=1 Tax=Thermacetogenium phaeum (strain ATCC BAA-254 / DSM 26808 / PB) TaxID=1089553 RepID=K4LK59_THEPS|nr:hydrogenase maturation protease [Thermacetogenium phaeum]AFV12457.1 hydrogenase maturation protease [Thermacetogenium phaeum DSM 12270]
MRKGRLAMGKKIVVGIGNLLLKDDGVGVHVIRALEGKSLSPEVELIDGGTAGCDLLPLLAGAEKIIVVDALQGGGPPGAIYRLTPEDCGRQSGDGTISLHDLGILVAFHDLQMLEGKPVPAVIIGVEPGEIGVGMELTPQVKATIPRVLELIEQELER